MSPNHVKKSALSPIAERVLNVERIASEESEGAIVIARREELIVHADARKESSSFEKELSKVAKRVGNLAEIKRPATEVVTQPGSSAGGGTAEPDDYKPDPQGPLSKVEIWRLKDTKANHSIDVSRKLRKHLGNKLFALPGDKKPLHTGVHPHHVAILSPQPGGCPATPPKPARADKAFVEPPTDGPTVKVTILDSGYIWIDPPHRELDRRVTVVRGQWLNAEKKRWEPDEPDGLYTDPSGKLDGITGHGTFIAGLISHIAPCTRLEVVGLRNQEVEIGALDRKEQLGLFETEVAIAHAMLRRCDTDVIQCGFAFPTLDDYPSLPFAAVMAELRSGRAPRKGVAVVAPAGNEDSSRPYWPAALPDVIGVAATDPDGAESAWFSNWGSWCDCCTGGVDVYSTFVRWPLNGSPRFRGWATWNGTSFAAPKVSAEIARKFAEKRRYGTTPAAVADKLIAGTKARSTDETGWPLPYLRIG
ncbi:MAG TPA: S8/S53 family peptidase [Solirubrobacteraceae bacterium]